MKRAGVDVGGTFTDVVVFDEADETRVGGVVERKVPSDPERLEVGIADGLLRAVGGAEQAAEIGFIGHGTTVATNVTLERTGPRVGFICTRGFRDIIEIARLARPGSRLYTHKNVMPEPVVRRRDCFEVTERVDASGQVVTALDEGEVREIVRTLAGRGIKALAVCLLFSFRNPAHERRIREIVRQIDPTIEVSLSCEVWPEFREYERASTTALNCYLRPAAWHYLGRLRAVIAEAFPASHLWVMQSNGGLATPESAADFPIRLVMSGPAGGVIAARQVAEQTGLRDLITVDMGGTSFDVAILPSGEQALVDSQEVMGLPVKGRALDILTIGSGGGSIAWVDRAGQFRVGPRSAGALPGPACYGHGGTEPTVTDADLVLGFYDAAAPIAGGAMTLDHAAAYAACERLGAKLGLDAVETAWGIRRIVNTAMAGAVRAASVRRGMDPRDFALLGFGGAGPVHSADIAAEMGMHEVVVPAVAGCFSALGIAMTDAVHDFVHTESAIFEAGLERGVQRRFGELAGDGERQLAASGIGEELHDFGYSVDLRYRGQNSVLNLSMAGPGRLAAAVAEFHAEHLRQFGYNAPGDQVEIVNLRLRAVGRIGTRVASEGGGDTYAPAATATRRIATGDGRWSDATVYELAELRPGATFIGPAVVNSADSTTVVPVKSTAQLDGAGNLRIRLEER